MNISDNAIASSIAATPVPEFPAMAIRTSVAQRRKPVFAYSIKQKLAAAGALFACCAGLAYGAPKIVTAIHLTLGSGKLSFIAPDTVTVTDNDLAAEQAFHVRLPSGWPADMKRGMAWRIGPPSSHLYVIQYSGTGTHAGSDAAVFLQKVNSHPAIAVGFRKRNGGPIGLQWTSGGEHISILSKNLSRQELQRIRESLP